MAIKSTQTEFIEKARAIHGDKFDYANVVYTGGCSPIVLSCKRHGEFSQTPHDHLAGKGCRKCANGVHTTTEFIEKVTGIHGTRYDYSEVQYTHSLTPVSIICATHGKFFIAPKQHLKGQGCQQCAIDLHKSSLSEFIKKAKKIHGDLYDYSLVVYAGSLTPVDLICLAHGTFKQTPATHLKGSGCPSCATARVSEGQRLTPDEFLLKANDKHQGRYDYSKANYIDSRTKIVVVCPVHGGFEQGAQAHLTNGCPKCAWSANAIAHTLCTTDFIARATEAHGAQYDYSRSHYTSAIDKVIVVCHIHGEFLQKPISHMRGSGCPTCKESNGEKIIRGVLTKKGVSFQCQYRTSECRNKHPLPFDFAITDGGELKLLIEYQGKQHYSPFKYFGGKEAFDMLQQRDSIKIEFCKDKGIPLLIIPHWDKEYIPTILESALAELTVSPSLSMS